MPKNQDRKSILLLILLISLPGRMSGQQPFPNASPLLKEEVRQAATDIASGKLEPLDGLDAHWPNIIGFLALDAARVVAADGKAQVVATKEQSLQAISVFPYLGETQRTDKQTGASVSAAGSTSVAEKPGIPLLISYAIEHGAIQSTVTGDTLTLSGSPYSLVTLAARESDNQSNFDRYKNWRRLGYSVTFNVNNSLPQSGGSGPATGPSSILGSLQPKQITEFSIRARILGERTTRSKAFMDFWKAQIRPIQVERDEVLTANDFNALRQNRGFVKATDEVKTDLLKAILDYLSKQETANATLDAKQADIESLILTALKEHIYDGMTGGTLANPLTQSQRENTIQRIAAIRKDFETAAEALQDEIDRINKSRLLTFEYTNHRNMMISGYSEFKLLYEDHVVALSPLEFDLIMNAGASVYSSPTSTRRQSSLRDFSGTLSAEGKHKNPFASPNGKDKSQVTYSLSGRYERLKETRADIAVAQFKLEIPIGMGASIPFSLSYANRTEYIKEKEVRGNFGVTLDLDKLYAITRKGLNP